MGGGYILSHLKFPRWISEHFPITMLHNAPHPRAGLPATKVRRQISTLQLSLTAENHSSHLNLTLHALYAIYKKPCSNLSGMLITHIWNQVSSQVFRENWCRDKGSHHFFFTPLMLSKHHGLKFPCRVKLRPVK